MPVGPASAAVSSAASACYSEAADEGDPVMRAAVMRNARLLVDTLPEPVPGPGEVLVRTLACGICGSDLHALKHAPRMVEAARESGLPFTLDVTRDVVMGHEFCAEVLDFGPHTERALKPGARVVSLPLAAGERQRDHARSEEHTSELQSHVNLVCRLLLEKKKTHKDS